MVSVGVNPPKTPVTEGSSDLAPATLPNVCKMPGPPAPFVPTPLPNIGQSSDRLTDATTTVTIEGKKVAIKGAYYMSQPSPDVASQGTGGGIVSSKTQGKTEFVAPGSMNVKAEGKNIQLLGDAMTNNGGSPSNAATTPGNQQPPTTKIMLDCGETGSYSKLKEKGAAPDYERDHVPSKAALREAALKRAKARGIKVNDDERGCIASKVEARGITVAIPKSSHRNFSPTCGSKNTPAQIAADAATPASTKAAVDRDVDAMQKHLDGPPKHECADAYREASKDIKAHDNEAMMTKAIQECTS
jgi:uncharacterized Zn-binding protein involved in type VI secretion